MPGCMCNPFRFAALVRWNLLVILLLMGTGKVRAEDVGLFIGINQYPKLRPGISLKGCVNDARVMESRIKQYGVKRTFLLTNAAATKAGILRTIASLRQYLQPGDRVVVFFAGHGTVSSRNEAVLLAYNSLDASEKYDITVQEFNNAISALPGQKIVLIDSCHSGGMVRNEAGLKSFNNRVPRFYVRTGLLNKVGNAASQTKDWQETEISNADTPIVRPTAGTVFFTACLKTQIAGETELGGVRHGIFTYYLSRYLNGKQSLWSDLVSAVSERVLSATENEQKPLFVPASALTSVVMTGLVAPKPTIVQISLDKLYNLSNPDTKKISLERTPKNGPVRVGSDNWFEMTVGTSGYLVLVNRDPAGKLSIVYPRQFTAEALRVGAGQQIRLPGPGKALRPRVPGTDSVKAILVTNLNAARALISPFLRGDGLVSLTSQEAQQAWKTRNREEVNLSVGFFTSEVITLILPQLDGAGTGTVEGL